MVRLLLIDDDPRQHHDLEMIRDPGWVVTGAATGREGIDLARRTAPDVVLLDLGLPDMDGLEVLGELDHGRLPVVMLTAHAEIPLVVRAVRAGAFDYVVKGPDFAPLVEAVRRAVAASAFRAVAAAPGGVPELERIVGTGEAARELRRRVTACSRSDASVCVVGESGTGKELVAEAIHRLSARGRGPLVALNCGAIPEHLAETELFGSERGAYTDAPTREGAFERASGGSLFLDEVGEMSLATQVKLLRAVETRRVRRVGGAAEIASNVRIIAATNRDLKQAVAQRRFREDLFYRIGVLVVPVPPLRERREDIPLLAACFLARIAPPPRTPVLSPEAADLLMRHDWPGNIRELRNVMERAVLWGEPGEGARTLPAASIVLF